MIRRCIIITALIAIAYIQLAAQEFSETIASGRLSGNFQLDAQYYYTDSIIGSVDVPEKILSNAFLNLLYNVGGFEFGVRYENYTNPIAGFDPRYKGSGIPYRFVTYTSELLDVTAGNFYEQFGSGMIFRTYEERQLGFDNAMDGLRFKVRPYKGLQITGLIGKQRAFWAESDGIIRGGDLSIAVQDVFPELLPKDITLGLGASAVSKYENPASSQYNLPANVFAYSTRLSLGISDVMLDAEYAYKYNDPNASNRYSYNPGTGLIVNASYSGEGFGVSLNLHRVDNMDFHSERDVVGNGMNISFIPPLTKQHTYRLPAIYPFATQLNGEAGLQAEITYHLPKNTFIGGKYGTTINLNYSRVQNLDTAQLANTGIDTAVSQKLRYDSPFFKFGDNLYFQDFNIEISRRFNYDFKLILTYMNLIYNKDVLQEGGSSQYGKIWSNVVVADIYMRFSDDHSLKTEIQHLWSTQDSVLTKPDNTNGNWALLLLEYTIAPAYYISVWDEYNYGNAFEANKIHYPGISFAFVHDATRISIGYARQRQGITCVGGVCREVPAANGFLLTITSSF
ncbi:MAG: hypothetical protein QG635_1747 [Bacteroidota bacterium]|nr:hypothetical protein [Bacteroidota bacterium]